MSARSGIEFPHDLLRPKPSEELFDVLHLHRTSREWSFDSQRFSQFNWLVFDEQVAHDDMGPGGRTLPSLFVNLGQDFGRIEPHKTAFPKSVEVALFGLSHHPVGSRLLKYKDMDWRGFRTPWVYTIDFDVFAAGSRAKQANEPVRLAGLFLACDVASPRMQS